MFGGDIQKAPGSDAADVGATTNKLWDTANDWMSRFIVPQVELGGFDTPGWTDVKKTFEEAPIDGRIGARPMPDGHQGPLRPKLGTFYRFEDFSKDGKAYDYDMNGQLRESGNLARRTVGAQAGAGTFLTTDLPLQEAMALKQGGPFPMAGNRYVEVTP